LPVPSQKPSSPQEVPEAVHALWATWPDGTGRHCPSVCPFKAFVQAEHPLQAWLQQTPSATTPDVHSKV
jgi:hypothetical protein